MKFAELPIGLEFLASFDLKHGIPLYWHCKKIDNRRARIRNTGEHRTIPADCRVLPIG